MGRWYRNFGSYFRGPYRIRNGRRQGMLGRGIRKYAGGFHKKITIPTAKAIMAKNWNTEKKYIETSNGSLSMTNTSWATPVCLNQVPQGISSLNRIGMQYRMNRLQVRFLVRANGNAAVAHRIRLVIFQVPQADLDDTTGVPITPVPQHLYPDGIDTFYNKAYTGRFRVLYSRIVNIAEPPGGMTVYSLNFNKPMRNIVKFTGSNDNQPVRGGIYMTWISDTSNVSEAPAAQYFTRVRFVDN